MDTNKHICPRRLFTLGKEVWITEAERGCTEDTETEVWFLLCDILCALGFPSVKWFMLKWTVLPKHLFQLNKCCPACGLKFERDEGFFLGSMSLNYGVTIFIFLGRC